jgi:polar amino acid transport system substrate-binding protein
VKGQPLADTNATVLAVQSGRAAAMGATQSGVVDIVHKAPKGTYKYVLQSDAQGAGVDQLALLAPKASGLGPVILDAFKVLFQTGTYEKLMKQYGLTDVAVEAPSMNVAGKA